MVFAPLEPDPNNLLIHEDRYEDDDEDDEDEDDDDDDGNQYIYKSERFPQNTRKIVTFSFTFYYPTPRNALSVGSFVCHVFYPI